jgi:hypothetical protein
MKPGLLLLLTLSLPTGAALSQEAAQPESPPLAEPALAPPEEPKRDVETLIPEEISSGGYGGPALSYSRILGGDAIFFGGKGGWIINHRFVLGGGGFALTSRVPLPEGAPNIGEELQLDFSYGGIWLEYIFLPKKLVHGSIGTLLGGGSMAYSRVRRVEHEDRKVESDVVFVAEPILAAELNISRFLRFSAGVGYRYVGSVRLTGLRQEDVSRVTGSVMLKFGEF